MTNFVDVNKIISKTGIRVYSFYGELDEMNSDTVFSAIIEDFGDFQNVRAILNLINLKYINSKSIGWIANLAERTHDGWGKIVLCNASREIRDALELGWIHHILGIYENERTADESFLE